MNQEHRGIILDVINEIPIFTPMSENVKDALVALLEEADKPHLDWQPIDKEPEADGEYVTVSKGCVYAYSKENGKWCECDGTYVDWEEIASIEEKIAKVELP